MNKLIAEVNGKIYENISLPSYFNILLQNKNLLEMNYEDFHQIENLKLFVFSLAMELKNILHCKNQEIIHFSKEDSDGYLIWTIDMVVDATQSYYRIIDWNKTKNKKFKYTLIDIDK